MKRGFNYRNTVEALSYGGWFVVLLILIVVILGWQIYEKDIMNIFLLCLFCAAAALTHRRLKKKWQRQHNEFITISNRIQDEIQRNRNYFEQSGVIMLVLGADGIIIMLNRRGQQELFGEDYDGIGENIFKKIVNEEDRDQLRRILNQCSGKSGEMELTLAGKGKEMYVAAEITCTNDGKNDNSIREFLLAGQDITERKIYAQQLATRYHFMKILHEMFHYGLQENDRSSLMAKMQEILCDNLHIEAICFFTYDSSSDVLDMKASRGVGDQLLKMVKNIPLSASVVVREAIGKRKMVVTALDNYPDSDLKEKMLILGYKYLICWPLLVAGMPCGAVIIACRDNNMMLDSEQSELISTIVGHSGVLFQNLQLFEELQQELNERKVVEKKLRETKNEAERANRLKSEFLANISHEIRTPLNAVIGFSELLGSHLQDSKMLAYVDAIDNAGRNLLMLINDILDLSKIEAGKMEIRRREVNVEKLISEVIQLFTVKVNQNILTIDYVWPENLSPNMLIDDLRLRQILINLIGNAVKFTARGWVKVFVQMKDNSELTIEIADSGVGIPESELQEIFLAFRQSSMHERKGDFGGTGLGLAITQKLIKLMDGTISVSSKEEVGSVFTISFPTVIVDNMLDHKKGEYKNEYLEDALVKGDNDHFKLLSDKAEQLLKAIRLSQIRDFVAGIRKMTEFADSSVLQELVQRLEKAIKAYDIGRIRSVLQDILVKAGK